MMIAMRLNVQIVECKKQSWNKKRLWILNQFFLLYLSLYPEAIYLAVQPLSKTFLNFKIV